jgi:hypothetical protein
LEDATLKTKVMGELKFIKEKRKVFTLTKRPDISSLTTNPKLFTALINSLVRLTS